MKITDKINEGIEKGYAYIFDHIENESLQEILTEARNHILARIFKKSEEKLELLKKQKQEEEKEYQESIKREIFAFKPFYKKAEFITQDKNERLKYIDAKFYELFFKAVDENQDTKNIFKFLIEELKVNFNLPPEKINEYKAFTVDYFLQREKVNLFYELFVKDSEPFYQRLFGRTLSEITGYEIKRGKLSLEVFIPEEYSRYITKYFGFRPNSGMAIASEGFYIFWFKYIKENILKNQRAGTYGEILVVNRDKDEEDEWDTYSVHTQSVLRHERKHIEFIFKNNSKMNIEEQEIDNQLLDAIKEFKLYGESKDEVELEKLIDICLQLVFDSIKNECLATATGSPITRYIETGTIKDIFYEVDVEAMFRVDREDMLKEKGIKTETYLQSKTFDRLLIESYDFFSKVEIYKKRKMEIIKLGKNKEERDRIERLFEIKEKMLLDSLSFIGDRLEKLISSHPQEKHYILNYLEMFPITQWERIITNFKILLKEA